MKGGAPNIALKRRQGDDAPPPRVIVFADTEEAAVAAATPLRNALWGKHKLAVLLPHGDEPIKVIILMIKAHKIPSTRERATLV